MASSSTNLSERKAREETLLTCEVYGGYITAGSTYTVNSEPLLDVSFSKPVKIHGVRFLGDCYEYDVTLVVNYSQKVSQKTRKRKIMLPVPIPVQANVVVHLKATVSGYACIDVGTLTTRETVETNGITVKFYNASQNCQEGGFSSITFSAI